MKGTVKNKNKTTTNNSKNQTSDSWLYIFIRAFFTRRNYDLMYFISDTG